jgi:hypothetical protein
MKYVLLITIIQNGYLDKFKEYHENKTKCIAAKIEVLKRDNSLTKVKAVCRRVK